MAIRPRPRLKLTEAQKQSIQKLKNDIKNAVDSPASQPSITEFRADLKAALSDRKLTQSEFQTLTNDVIEIVSSAGVTATEARSIFYSLQDIAEASRFPKTNDTVTGTTQNDVLWGGLGQDSLNGAGSDDAGVGEVDYLIGGGGKDTFIVGDATQTFYDDGQADTPGLLDYAVIVDFNPQQDTIQLHGSAADYTLAALPPELAINGVGIYSTVGSQTPAARELVGVVVGANISDFSTGFTFV
jgi:Ca2+-binding RTX toxin-like protein